MNWRDKANEDCGMCQVLYRDDGAPLGCVLRLEGGPHRLRLYDHGCFAALGLVPDRRRGQRVELRGRQ